MARPRSIAQDQTPGPNVSVPQVVIPVESEDPQAVYFKTIQLAVGLDLLGSRQTLQAVGGTTLKATEYGVEAFSKKTGRKILVTWNNIRGGEYLK